MPTNQDLSQKNNQKITNPDNEINYDDVLYSFGNIPEEKIYWIQDTAWLYGNKEASIFPLDDVVRSKMYMYGFTDEMGSLISDEIWNSSKMPQRFEIEVYLASLGYKELCKVKLIDICTGEFPKYFKAAGALSQEVYVSTLNKQISLMDSIVEKFIDAFAEELAETCREQIYLARQQDGGIDYFLFYNNIKKHFIKRSKLNLDITDRFIQIINKFADILTNKDIYTLHNLEDVRLNYENQGFKGDDLEGLTVEGILASIAVSFEVVYNLIMNSEKLLLEFTPKTFFQVRFANHKAMETKQDAIVCRELNIADEKRFVSESYGRSMNPKLKNVVPIEVQIGIDAYYDTDFGVARREVTYREFPTPGLVITEDYIQDIDDILVNYKNDNNRKK